MECGICDGIFNSKRDCCPYCGAIKIGNKHYDYHNKMIIMARVLPREVLWKVTNLKMKGELA